jgi:hypothetical protein
MIQNETDVEKNKVVKTQGKKVFNLFYFYNN